MNRVKSISIFLLCGLFSGALFGWLTQVPSLKYFWFIKGDKFLIETYKYWIGLSNTFLLGLVAGYALARLSGSLPSGGGPSPRRAVIAIVLVAASVPSVELIGELMFVNSHSVLWDFIAAPLICVLILSIAIWVLTGRWHYSDPPSIVLMLTVALALVYVISGIFAFSNYWINISQFAAIESLLAGFFGYRLISTGLRKRIV